VFILSLHSASLAPAFIPRFRGSAAGPWQIAFDKLCKLYEIIRSGAMKQNT
jgi:hypothetical protein